ncbi:MAG: MBL fold metallo-hydrolase [Candidatus Taylorbacteria bacterium]|nr:MBL fold metallo-hydrolase [Candidatus Taylorbacteria bacterium]
MSSASHLTFHGGVGTATGSNFLLEGGGVRILVDCGLLQGVPGAERWNRRPFPYRPHEIDFLAVTHAHLDHIGLIPRLVKEGFRGVIYSTEAARSISEVMFEDAARILAEEAKALGLSPLYDLSDVRRTLSLWWPLEYHSAAALGGEFEITLRDAGHILGSAMIEFKRDGRRILFTGDLGNSPAPLLKDVEMVTGSHYLVIESVYGDRNHEPKEERQEKFKRAIESTIKKGGTLIVPAFSIERTQVLLYELNRLVEGHKIQSLPVFLDSPLSIRVTKIYKNRRNFFKPSVLAEMAAGDDIFSFPGLKLTESGGSSRAIARVANPKIIIAGSGMSEGGRVVSHEKIYLPDRRNTILLVGYQSVGTLGRLLAEGAREVLIDGERVPVRAEVRVIYSYSSHMDSNHLVEFAARSAATLKEVFVVLGEPRASLFLTQRLRDYVGLNAVYPELGKIYELR